MIEIVWEYIVKAEAGSQFELAYGPDGPWCELFARSPGFRGTRLLRDMKNPQRYVIVDVWDTLEQLEKMLADYKEEYAKLDAEFAGWTMSETEVGIFLSPEA